MRALMIPDTPSLGEALALLGVASSVDGPGLTRAFRSAVKAAHPGQSGGEPERFRRVIAAHRVIQDHRRATPPVAAPTVPFLTAPALPVITITPLQALAGGTARVAASGCDFKVSVPAGVRSGDRIRLKAAARNGADLCLPVLIRAVDGLVAVGDDLFMVWPVPPRLLDDGGRVEIDTHAGLKTAWVVGGLDRPIRVRLRDLGLPARGARRRGHLFVTLEPDRTVASQTEDRLARFTALWTPRRMAA